ncbi:unnamed protein product [Didymodactylos carnosus]|uniref:Uncharacterized protein n=1 Tax=Didymodactylos carnosus TaxID=1234261 RepID=A0A8S2F6U9_9BILA|nr:unnamed protein product [Didymodactylos carnosus]CAF4184551.1 unnamed protein product [Didymodactylos carnosus]
MTIEWSNDDQLFYGTGIFIDPNESNSPLYIVDTQNERVLQYDAKGTSEGHIVVLGGEGRGDGVNQLENPQDVTVDPQDAYHIYVDEEESVYVADHENHRIMKWKKGASEGEVVAGGNGRGRNLNQLCYPSSVYVDRRKSVYVTDTINDRIVRWLKGAKSGSTVIAGSNKGDVGVCNPKDLTFDRNGNLYLTDENNMYLDDESPNEYGHGRVQMFALEKRTLD